MFENDSKTKSCIEICFYCSYTYSIIGEYRRLIFWKIHQIPQFNFSNNHYLVTFELFTTTLKCELQILDYLSIKLICKLVYSINKQKVNKSSLYYKVYYLDLNLSEGNDLIKSSWKKSIECWRVVFLKRVNWRQIEKEIKGIERVKIKEINQLSQYRFECWCNRFSP